MTKLECRTSSDTRETACETRAASALLARKICLETVTLVQFPPIEGAPIYWFSKAKFFFADIFFYKIYTIFSPNGIYSTLYIKCFGDQFRNEIGYYVVKKFTNHIISIKVKLSF